MTQPTRFDPTGESNIGAPLSRATLLFLLASLLLLSIPCHAATYTVCNAGPPACTFNNVQDAINAAAFGDQILLQAGQTFSGFQLKYKPGPDGNPIVITTTAQAFLPVPGTRITPAYSSGSSPVTARIQGWLGPTVTTQNGTSACPGSATSCPAHDYTLVGLEIVPGAATARPTTKCGSAPSITARK